MRRRADSGSRIRLCFSSCAAHNRLTINACADLLPTMTPQTQANGGPALRGDAPVGGAESPASEAIGDGSAGGERGEIAGRPIPDPVLRLFGARQQRRRGLVEAAARELAALLALGFAAPDLELERAAVDLALDGPPEAAAEAAECALDGAGDDAALRSRALVLRATALHRLDHRQAAMRDLITASRLADEAGAIDERIDALRAMAIVESWRGRVDEAMLHLTTALADVAIADDRLLLGALLGDCGRVELEAGRFARALAFFDRSAALAAGCTPGRAAVRLDLARARAATGLRRHDEALALLDRVAAADPAHRSTHVDTVAAQLRARIHLQSGDAAACRDLVAAMRGSDGEPSFANANWDMLAAEAGLLLDDAGARETFEGALGFFATRHLAVHEVEGRLRLAVLLGVRGETAAVAETLDRALLRCRISGLSLLEREVRETMVRLGVTFAFAEEVRRTASEDPAEVANRGYVLLEKLGSGRFATVYRAHDVERAREVAFKRFSRPASGEPGLRDAFEASARREMRVAARLNLPGVARVLAVGTEPDGGFYTVQDHVAGPSLRAVMAERRTTVEVLRTTARIARTLADVHAAGVVHRDVKPDNIIVRDHDEPVLIDLGIAVDPSDATGRPARGTEGYAAAEQWLGEACGPPADVHALAVVLHEWLLGAPPIPPCRDGRRVEDGERPALTARARLVASVGEKVAGIVAAALSSRPDRRPTAKDFAEGLAAAARAMDGERPATTREEHRWR